MNKIVLLLSVITIMGCTPEFYSPNRVNIPELSKKKDFKISVAKGYIDFEAQTAYAITNHFGLMCNYANISSRTSDTNFELGGGRLLEIGGGYFVKKEHLIFENYATIGRGSFFNRAEFINSTIEDEDGKLDADFSKLGVQSTLTFQHDLLSVSGGLRFTNIQYTNITGNMYSGSQNLREFLNLNSNYNFLEPVFQIGIGFKHVRFNVQYQKSFNLNQNDYYNYNKVNYSAGIQLSFPAIKSKKKDEIKPI
ncbi:MAG TPA: hypothetical protein PKA12_09365 [Saprospiraceae bacterium]|nr:hypothetical protein [Saprospiraceae bacterium]